MPREHDYQRCFLAFVERDYARCVDQAMQLLSTRSSHELLQILLISLQRLGETQLVEQVGAEALDAVAGDPWESGLLKLTLGEASPQELDSLAENEEQRCQVLYYLGAWLLTYGKTELAEHAFNGCLSKEVDCLEGQLAEMELALLRSTSDALSDDAASREIGRMNREVLHLFKLGSYEQAIPIAVKAREMAGRYWGEHDPEYAQILHSLAALYYVTGNYAEAERLFRSVLEIEREELGEDDPRYGSSLSNLADLYRETGRYAESASLWEQALDIFRTASGGDHLKYAAALNNLALLHEAMGDYAQAESINEQARAFLSASVGEDDPNYARTLNNLAQLHRRMGNYTDAEPVYRRALEIYGAAGNQDHPSYATTLTNLADLYRHMGRYAEAEPLYRQAVEIYRATLGQDHPNYANNLNSLALFYPEIGKGAQAESLFKQALEVYSATLGQDHPSYARSLNNLADLYRATHRAGEAESLYRQALDVFHTALGQDHFELSVPLANLAQLCLEEGRYAEAEPLYKLASGIIRSALGADHPQYASSLNNQALLHKEMGNDVEAESLYRQALEVCRAALGPNHPTYAHILFNLAGLLVAMGRSAEALNLMEQSVAINDRLIGQIFSFGSETQRMKFIRQVRVDMYGFLSVIRRDAAESIGAARAALDLVLRRKAIGAEALAIQRDAVLGASCPHLKPQIRQWFMLRQQIAQKTLAGPGRESPQTYQERLAQWITQKERLEEELARQIPEMSLEQKLRAADRRAVASSLPERSVLIEFIWFDVFDFHARSSRNERRWKQPHYLAFVLPAGGPDNVRMIDLGEADPIDRMIGEFRECFVGLKGRHVTPMAARTGRPIPEAMLATGKALRRAVFDPLVEALAASESLLLAPDGELARLPFGLLPTDDGRLLVEDMAISYINCGRDVLRFGAATTGQPTKSLVAADPDFDFGDDSAISTVTSESSSGRRSRDFDGLLHFPIDRLGGTVLEGTQIAGMLGIPPWLEGEVLEGRLKTECHSPRILHLATHGFFLEDQHRELRDYVRRFGLMDRLADEGQRLLGQVPENPLLRSGLIMAGVNTWHKNGKHPLPGIEDGLLTAEDVTALDLLATELVVLSACDTGLGENHKGEGVFGLQRAFTLAGAGTLIMSLWKVPDPQTQELMVDFYRRLLVAGEGKAEALRGAQLAMKEKYPDPYFWGAFVCLGNPAPLLAGDLQA